MRRLLPALSARLSSVARAPPLHVCVVAGEPSGDAIGASLMRALRKAAPRSTGVSFSGVGGPLMAGAGLSDSLFPMSDLSVMGLTEILPALPRLHARANTVAAHVARSRPDVVVTVDAKGFNLRVLRRAREMLRRKRDTNGPKWWRSRC